MLQTISTGMLDKTNRGTILIADDDPIVVEAISTILKNAGWAVVSAKNGREALETIYTRHIDALILDIRMPELDGYEVCLNLLRRGKKIPTLVMTGCPDERQPLSYLNVSQFMRKPVRSQDLLEFVDTVNSSIEVKSA